MTLNRHDIEPYVPEVAKAIRLDFGAYKDDLTPELVEQIIYFRLLNFLARGVGRGGESECPSCGCPTKFGHEGDCDIMAELERLSCTDCQGEGCSKCRDRGMA